MEFKFEPGSELGPADELRQAKANIVARWKSVGQIVEEWRWSGWSVGWPLAKMAVMEAESEVQQFGVSWAEAWERAEARASAALWMMAGEQALLLAKVLGEARAQARGERVPDRLAYPPMIAEILTSLNRSRRARDLWDDSLEMRGEGDGTGPLGRGEGKCHI